MFTVMRLECEEDGRRAFVEREAERGSLRTGSRPEITKEKGAATGGGLSDGDFTLGVGVARGW
jgi:hypothetical protein